MLESDRVRLATADSVVDALPDTAGGEAAWKRLLKTSGSASTGNFRPPPCQIPARMSQRSPTSTMKPGRVTAGMRRASFGPLALQYSPSGPVRGCNRPLDDRLPGRRRWCPDAGVSRVAGAPTNRTHALRQPTATTAGGIASPCRVRLGCRRRASYACATLSTHIVHARRRGRHAGARAPSCLHPRRRP